MRKKTKIEKPQYYIVMNQDNEVFTGLVGGYPNYSGNWENAKPLQLSNTSLLTFYNSKLELIKEEDFY